MIEKKKTFPKLQKSLKKFLTDESGKITKKNALGISLGAIVLGITADDAFAGHSNSYPTSTTPAGVDPFPTDSSVYPNGSGTKTWTIVNSATCNHASGIVNGHYSSVPTVNISSQQIDYNKSHSNHGSHSSGGWC